jgi:hypothetical protein
MAQPIEDRAAGAGMRRSGLQFSLSLLRREQFRAADEGRRAQDRANSAGYCGGTVQGRQDQTVEAWTVPR